MNEALRYSSSSQQLVLKRVIVYDTVTGASYFGLAILRRVICIMEPRSLEEKKKDSEIHCWLENQDLCFALTSKCKFFDIKLGCLIAAFLNRKN